MPLQPGDANLDGVVGIDDFLLLRKHSSTEADWMRGDFNGDGRIDLGDFDILAANFGAGFGAKSQHQPFPNRRQYLNRGSRASVSL